MEKGRPMLRWAGILCVSMAVAGFGLNALGGKQELVAKKQMGADLVTIETLKKFGKLEYPVVQFEHDKHSKALENKCDSCHGIKGGKVVALFKRESDNSAAEIKAVYHDNCIKCHTETTKAGKKSGPDSGQCRTCHAGSAESSRTLISFDKSMHFRHASSKMVLPAPGQKENCSKCHTNDKAEKRNLIFAENKDQAHEKCISCHMEIAKAKKDTGPIVCAGCHDAKLRAGYKVVKETTRLEAGQTDYALLMAPVKPGTEQKQFSAVSFNHKAHEEKTENCSACHHNAMTKGVVACSQCHTPLGKEEGAFITTEQAMHRVTAQESCVGCHAKAQAKPECSGCHAFMGKKDSKADGSCVKCHVNIAATPELTTDKNVKAKAAELVAATRPKKDTVMNVEEIPETVEIGVLSGEFAASKFPHRKIVKKIMTGMENNKLASYFHSSPNAVCAGCHHNSPASATPPKCASCHGKVQDKAEGVKPALKAAYHQQCMGCHREMGIQKPADTACIECHAKKQ